ncbi:hypothetical protein GCM10020367_06050 [Streptomyces sannanensis]|uniref:Integrase catalytic domain-containing protein n=1 Tax=Streptomyces sannanensis TaxID=285536 RepID=A0ABP6S4X6_9ACTN
MLKAEIGTTVWESHEAARTDVFRFIEVEYNRTRLRKHPPKSDPNSRHGQHRCSTSALGRRHTSPSQWELRTACRPSGPHSAVDVVTAGIPSRMIPHQTGRSAGTAQPSHAP